MILVPLPQAKTDARTEATQSGDAIWPRRMDTEMAEIVIFAIAVDSHWWPCIEAITTSVYGASSEQAGDIKQSLEFARDSPDDVRFFGAALGVDLVGFATWCKRPDGFELGWDTVLPGLRGQGIAARLTDARLRDIGAMAGSPVRVWVRAKPVSMFLERGFSVRETYEDGSARLERLP